MIDENTAIKLISTFILKEKNLDNWKLKFNQYIRQGNFESDIKYGSAILFNEPLNKYFEIDYSYIIKGAGKGKIEISKIEIKIPKIKK